MPKEPPGRPPTSSPRETPLPTFTKIWPPSKRPAPPRIYLCWDGDPWIKKGLEILPNSVFVLDLFHLDKYLTAALQRDSEGYREVWEGLRTGDQVKVEGILKEVERTAESPNQKKAIRACRRYIRNNWDGIMA
ncbi:MAG: UPF0236 family protein [Thermoanaerobacteraceae bacterium]|nr:UPF0236 family protein [Thermoanaerobacteraceae bacterium]